MFFEFNKNSNATVLPKNIYYVYPSIFGIYAKSSFLSSDMLIFICLIPTDQEDQLLQTFIFRTGSKFMSNNQGIVKHFHKTSIQVTSSHLSKNTCYKLVKAEIWVSHNLSAGYKANHSTTCKLILLAQFRSIF